ncbi:MAG: hypothetical protein ABI622_03385 [Chloroflexota bacterium]
MDRRATRVMARGRLQDELRAIVLDMLGPCEPDELPAAVAAWVDGATDRAVSAVCDRSVEALVEALESAVAGAPRDVLVRLDQAAARHDAGLQ